MHADMKRLVAAWPLSLLACVPPAADVGELSGTVGTTGVAASSESGTEALHSSGAVESSSTGAAQTSAEPGSSSGADGPVLDVGAGETGGEPVECDEQAPSTIHVLNADHEIWSYAPELETWELVTGIPCAQIMGSPTGFAIERSGRVLLLTAEPFDPQFGGDPALMLTAFMPGAAVCETLYYGALGSGIDCADLATVSDPADPTHDLTWAHSCTGGGFTLATVPQGGVARLDTADDEPSFSLLAQDLYTSVALAGTGDARLFGISGDQEQPGSTVILEFDHDTGMIAATTPLPEVEIGAYGFYFALAFYGGDLYTFGRDAAGTKVYRVDWDDTEDEHVVEVPAAQAHPFAAGIVAAASPTCIPLTPAG
jgi:hypothetical protein